MRRMRAAGRTDAEIQARNGLYLATGVVLLVSAAALDAGVVLAAAIMALAGFVVAVGKDSLGALLWRGGRC